MKSNPPVVNHGRLPGFNAGRSSALAAGLPLVSKRPMLTGIYEVVR